MHRRHLLEVVDQRLAAAGLSMFFHGAALALLLSIFSDLGTSGVCGFNGRGEGDFNARS